MKTITQSRHSKLANDALYYIYRHMETDINIDELCKILGVSRFHFQRLFKAQMGMNIYEMVKSIRLQKAASLLITNPSSTVTQVANMCGYSSQTSFIRAFKARFSMTPTQWRQGGYKKYTQNIIDTSDFASASIASYKNLEPCIVKQPDIRAFYIRHKGYSPKVKQIWQKIQAWIYSNEIENYTSIGIYHDNPIVTPLEECYYIAAIQVEDNTPLENTSLPSFVIPKGLYAKFDVQGKYGDILKLIQWVYQDWLPQSGYEATTLPSYTIFRKNHFLSEDGEFDVAYYLSVRLR
ncbi:GyrI-like domain-containing protein [Nitratifractor sp.]|uniref:AraC family transcriptional regulator n=1 Tax=Nitratifractor sp. TaxID=2268144 RepID=UPI0025E9B0FA|nr:AraC family transcriptional regulator [Nitratifractor sp.]